MKAVEGYIDRARYRFEGDRLLIDVWAAMWLYIHKRFPYARRVIWSCRQEKWRYVLFAEIEETEL